ncbi:putative virion core protein P4b precursor [Parapoxvirus red deer/HL953]|uniref:Virion core protein 4b n=1 Tax=Parapoxvirus red deer/HL953 TaxID=1579460 RepID=A0A0A7M9S5_9POXV|nr:putative virion core protein P4b precursor [Parapoxvirus red deer/HL953]AIZ77330.1 putative virion core protein P4b precursor [Parapoxvirus red deer/HL953]
MESSAAPACVDAFFSASFDLAPAYDHSGLSLECDHIHVPQASMSCGVCNALSTINREDMVSAGARAQRPVRSRSESRGASRRSGSGSSRSRSSSSRPSSRGAAQSSARGSSGSSSSGSGSGSSSVLMPVDRLTSMHEWQMQVRREGEMIADYLKSTNYDPRNMTIQDLMSVMSKLGIRGRDRSELFDLLTSVRAAMADTGMTVSDSHPLVMIYTRNSQRVNRQMKELESLYNLSSYQNLLSTTQFQSSHFKDMSSSSDLLFSFKSCDSVSCVHPIVMALFGVRLPALEAAFVIGDSLSLLQQLHHNHRVRPNNYQLLVSKLTEEAAIVIPGVSDAVSMEIQRAVMHTTLRRCILNLRMGIFHCDADESIDNQLMKIIHPACASIMSDEEQILASIFSIASFRPTLVSVTRPSFGTGIGGALDMSLRHVPYLVVDSSKLLTTANVPLSIGGQFSCAAEAGRVLYMPSGASGLSGSTDVASAVCAANSYIYDRERSPVITNGVVVFLVERRASGLMQTGDCFTSHRPVISDIPIEVAQDLTMNGIMYRLLSAVCHRVGDGAYGCGYGADSFANGYCTILFTDAGPWLYDPLSVMSRSAREARLTRAMRNVHAQEGGAGADVQGLHEWLRGDGAAALAAKQSQHMQHKAMFEDDLLTMEEAMAIISKTCTILVYAQEYDPYMSSRNMCDVLG